MVVLNGSRNHEVRRPCQVVAMAVRSCWAAISLWHRAHGSGPMKFGSGATAPKNWSGKKKNTARTSHFRETSPCLHCPSLLENKFHGELDFALGILRTSYKSEVGIAQRAVRPSKHDGVTHVKEIGAKLQTGSVFYREAPEQRNVEI